MYTNINSGEILRRVLRLDCRAGFVGSGLRYLLKGSSHSGEVQEHPQDTQGCQIQVSRIRAVPE